MEAKRSFTRRYRIVFQSSPMLLKCALLATILVSVIALSALGAAIADTAAETERLRKQAAIEEQQRGQYQQSIEGLGTVESVKDIAGSELGMVDQDATIIPVN